MACVTVVVEPDCSVGVLVANVTGTFFQATQPVSLATNTPTLQSGSTTTVTQATGTNLHTVTDSGSVTNATLTAETTKVIGTVNVAAAQTRAVTQATAANLNATVVGNGTFAVQAAITQAATNELTVGAVAIRTPPPAGAAASISVADIVPVIFVST